MYNSVIRIIKSKDSLNNNNINIMAGQFISWFNSKKERLRKKYKYQGKKNKKKKIFLLKNGSGFSGYFPYFFFKLFIIFSQFQ